MTRRRPTRRKPQPSFWTNRINNQWDWHWRSLAAIVYLVVISFDYVAMPLYREATYNKLTVPEMVKIAQSMKDPASQVETLKILKEDRKWTPLTNDMFHLSFGAILGVAALPQNRRRRRTRDDYDYDGGYEEDYSPDDDESDVRPRYTRAPDVHPMEQPIEDVPNDPPFNDGLPPETGRME